MRCRRPPRRKLRSAFGDRRHSRSPTAALRIVMEIWNDSSQVLNGFVHRLERDLAGGDGGQRGFPVHRWGRLADEPTAGFHSGKIRGGPGYVDAAAGCRARDRARGVAPAAGTGRLAFELESVLGSANWFVHLFDDPACTSRARKTVGDRLLGEADRKGRPLLEPAGERQG
jgi:hypothetical protein